MTYNQVLGEFENWSMVVLYATGSGEILHTHQSITAKGGKHPTKRQLEQDAREAIKQVSETKAIPKRVSILHVDPRTLDHDHDDDSHYEVDVKKRILVKVRKPMPRKNVKSSSPTK